MHTIPMHTIPMHTILVTGVGGGVGQSIVKALAGTPYRVIGVDSDPLAAGLHAVPAAYLGLEAREAGYAERLLEICRVENCELIFPGLDVELLPLAEAAERFRHAGVIPIVSNSEVIKICDDKLATNEFLHRHGFAAPRTCRLKDATALDYPVVLKPQRGGARSRRTYVARTPEDFERYRSLVDGDNCVVQEYLAGDEYTCGTVNLEGRCRGVIVMRRILRDGDTYKAFVERNPRIETHVREVVEALRPFGACNVQLRLKDGAPHVFEINARSSGTTAARVLAGFNEPKSIADYLLRQIEPSFTIREITVLRYWQELAVANDRIEQLTQHRRLTGGEASL